VACREPFGKPGPATPRGFSMSFSRGLPDREASVLDRMSSAFGLDLVWPRFGLGPISLVLAQYPGSILQLAFERLDLLGKGAVIAGQVFDFADRVKHGGVIPSAEPAPDFGQ